jgi:hypothetical protein
MAHCDRQLRTHHPHRAIDEPRTAATSQKGSPP